MNYAERLKYIQSLPDDEALESIMAEASETSERQTRDRLYGGALVAETETRYGENTISDIAAQLGIRPKTAYQWAEVVQFYHGFYHCLDILNDMPDVRYTHLRAAMSWGKHISPDDDIVAADVAFNRLADAHDNNELRGLESQIADDKKAGEPQTTRVSFELKDIRDVDDIGRIYNSIRMAFESRTLVKVTIEELTGAKQPEAAD